MDHPEPIRAAGQDLKGLSVLIMTTNLSLGGVSASVLAMASTLRDLGAACTVRALTDGGPLQGVLEERGISSGVLGVPKHSHSFQTTRAVAATIADSKPKVVHCHSFEANFHASLARLRGAPVPWLFVTQHDPRWRLHRVILNRWLRRVPDRVVVVSEGLGRLYQRWCGYSSERLFLLPNPVDTKRFSPAPKDVALASELGLAADSFIIGNVGGFGSLKGQEVLVRAFAALGEVRKTAQLVLVGEGKHRPAVEDLCYRLGVADRVVFAGQRDDIPRFLSLFDVYVQPSWQEADPVAVKEAMAAGKAVVSTATIGPSGFLEHGVTGILVPLGDWREMAQALTRLATDCELRSRLGGAARRYAEGEFSLDTYRRRLAMLYAPVVSGPAE